MRASLVSLKSVRISVPQAVIKPYEIPALSSISHNELPNNGFGNKNYFIQKTQYKHWPVYLKVQNTKLTTEIKRIKGDVSQFKKDLLALNPTLQITVNNTAGYVNIKGNVVDEIKEYFDKELSNI
ncbi:60S ribosomal protein [Scheffersomyces xylosifermentans]|uniref:60S ribosomal protein n=1 Tax=Scheffersomyces xylosifermentans TaxID=1304137 RepID=UPI00315CE992